MNRMTFRNGRHRLLDLWSWRTNCLSWSHWSWEHALLYSLSIMHALIHVTCIRWIDSTANPAPIFVLILANAVDFLILMLKLHLLCVHLPCHVGLLGVTLLGTYR